MVSSPFEFYFADGDGSSLGTDGFSYGYVSARSKSTTAYDYTFDGYVCDNGGSLGTGGDIDISALNAICASMGFSDPYINPNRIYTLSMSGNDKIPMVLDLMTCSESEIFFPSLNCSFRDPHGSASCSHSECIWLSCTGNGSSSIGVDTGYPVFTEENNVLQFKLTNNDEGYIYTPNGWVCGDSFGYNEAVVVCYEMGLGMSSFSTGHFLSSATSTGEFQFGSDDIGLGDVSCIDSPSGIADCYYTYDSDCTSADGIYLDCRGTFVDLLNEGSEGSSSKGRILLLCFGLITSIVIICCCCAIYIYKSRDKKKRQLEADARRRAKMNLGEIELKKRVINKKDTELVINPFVLGQSISEYLTINPTEGYGEGCPGAVATATTGVGEFESSFENSESKEKIERIYLGDLNEKETMRVENMTTVDSVDLYASPDSFAGPGDFFNDESIPGASTNFDIGKEGFSGTGRGSYIPTPTEEMSPVVVNTSVITESPSQTDKENLKKAVHDTYGLYGEPGQKSYPEILY